ncbi:MAG: NAD(+)/NADH kinase [Pirellulales bacterium]|nr:NAD(+)/NADH kinase [Pirellulales bacterium]
MKQTGSSSETEPQRPRVILLADGSRANIRREVERLQPLIDRYVDIVHYDFDFTTDLTQIDAEFALVLGGDGSVLRAARQMAYHQKPVLGVNLGRLGFLTDLQPELLGDVLPEICSGKYRLVDHLMFECHILHGDDKRHVLLGLNEAAVLAGPPFSILDIQLYVDGELVTTYSCDGLIVSTPVGSTAHSLSAGGPILRKNLQVFVVSPISPHTLTNRPVVDSAERVYELVVPRPHDGTTLIIDGQVIDRISASDRIRIERAESVFQLVEVAGHGYYRTLREKLGWGGQLKTDG